MIREDDAKALREFVFDADCLGKLRKWTEKFNLFDVLRVSKYEVRHSNVLAWLLNPNENHRLGDAFLKGLMSSFLQKLTNEGKWDNDNTFRLLLLNFYSFCVYREWKYIDILLVSDDEKIVIAIENKVESDEHDNQLERYKEVLKEEYKDYEKIYIYLTVDGEQPSDTEWCILNYGDILKELKKINLNELPSDVALFIENYTYTIERDIVDNSELVKICNEIYGKHKKALDLIYENIIDDRNQVADSIREVLRDLAKDETIIYEEENDVFKFFIRFYTKKMNELLPNLEKAESSWNDKHTYSYWLQPCKDNKIMLVFELGGKNVPENTMQNMQRLIKKFKPNDRKKEEFTYKRLYSESITFAENIDEDHVKKEIKSKIEEMLQSVEENYQ